jgi:uncharacterized protein YajQ (UPF0234 family)
MAKDFSFDIVSDYDIAEVTNAVDQTQRELMQRYDFKGTSASIDFIDKEKKGLNLTGDTEYQLKSIIDVLQSKLLKRGVSLKVLDTSGQMVQGGKEMRWTVPFLKGLDQEKAKKVTKTIRDAYPKVKAQIQGEEVRVSSTSKDDLQGVMNLLRAADFDFPLDFRNLR